MREEQARSICLPTNISKLQQAVRLNSPESYKEYAPLWSTIKVKPNDN
jgi:hypothetical protein